MQMLFVEYKCHFIWMQMLFVEYKCHFIGFVKIFIEPSEILGVVSCCFMDDKNLKNLKKLLSQDQINLSNVITTAINNANAFEINEINLTSAHFIFNVSNNFLSGKSRLTIEVPRVKLENIKLPDIKEIYVNQWYINIFINTLIFSINIA